MSQLLLNMAQKAAKDPSLLAGLIDKYTIQTGSTWAEIAADLQISSTQLARLALCRQPKGTHIQETRQIADYVQMSPVVLNHFFEKVQDGAPTTKNPTVYTSKTIENRKQSNQRKQFPIPIGRSFLAKKYMWTIGLALVLLLVISAFVMAQATAVSEATLVVNSGEVIITRPGSGLAADKTDTAVSGDAVLVTAGDTVTTDATATAQLHFAKGGTVDIFESTSVEITELITNDNTYQVTLTMLAGRTMNRVVHLLGIYSHYEVRSPSSTASVRGTIFTVDILSQESTFVSVDEGVVNVSMGDQSVDVKAGFEVTAVIGELLTVKPQNQEALPTPIPTIVPTQEPLSIVEPTSEPEPTNVPETIVDRVKNWGKVQLDRNGVPIVPILTPVDTIMIPDQGLPGGDDDSSPGSATDSGKKDPSNGGNPHEGMAVPGNTPSDTAGQGQPPTGGAVNPGQGGTPPGQTGNPSNPGGGGDNNGGDNNGGGNNGGGNNGGGNSGGGKKDK